MSVIQREVIVPYTPAQMYELVDAIERYPEFLPWCRSAKEHNRTETEVTASLTLAHGGLHKSFTTRNHLTKNERIEVFLVSGPFKHLEGIWLFEALPDNHCRVELDFEFEITGLLAMLLKPIFSQIMHSLVDAFTKRAQVLYGK